MIVVLNRMHLDEWPADKVEKILKTTFRDHPVVKWFSRERPPSGMKRRGHEDNIMRCFPGNPDGNREERDAYTITELCQDARLVLDIHGSKQAGSYAFYRSDLKNSLVKGVASLVANKFVLAAEPGPTAAHLLPNYVGWELEPNSPVLDQLAEYLEQLAEGWVPPTQSIPMYQGVGSIREAAAVRLSLPEELPRGSRLDDAVALKLGVPAPLYVLCWSAKLFGHTEYRGKVMTTM